jgi:hypothetical protein
MLAESVDEDEVIARVAAVDVGKAELPATTTPANPHAASAPQPPRQRTGRQRGAPHRTNDVDGDKR